MHFTYAIARQPGPDFAAGITTSDFGAPQYEVIVAQHAKYVEILEKIGLQVTILEALPGFPDAHFVEDVAVVTPDVAVITNPGAAARSGEKDFIVKALEPYRELADIKAPGTLDGGDVLMVDTHFFIGISDRTNLEGATQLGRSVEMFGNTWEPVPVGAGLHLKSSVNYVGANTLTLSPEFAEQAAFAAYDKIVIDPIEEYACNTLFVNDVLITPAGFPKTRTQLNQLGLEIIEIDVSEARKMDGGLTCMSLRF
jgi:dimethylargininase